jgi:hypothetical protein
MMQAEQVDEQEAHAIVRRVERLAESTGRACEEHRVWVLAACSVLYVVVIGLIAVQKPLENDELFTWHIATLPGMGDVWAALMAGGEQLPPFFYVVTRASLSVLGDNNLALRLPAMLGFWFMCVCLFVCVANRSSVLHGTVAMLFVLTTGAYYYAFDARPYGLVLGFCGVALVCWQALADGARRRGPLLVGLAASLGAANACHYYAILALLPFVCGEFVRLVSRRRLDLGVVAALAASLAPFWIFAPLIQAARAYSTGYWARPVWGDIPGFFYFMLTSSALPMTAIVLVAALYYSIRPAASGTGDEPRPSGLRGHEVALALGFLALPFVAVALAVFVTGAFTNRYAMPATLGLGLLVPFGFRQVLGRRAALTLILVLCLAAGFARRGGMTLQESAKSVTTRESIIAMLQASRSDLTDIVCSDPHLFIILSHYAPPEVRSRLLYLADAGESTHYLGHNSVERGMLDLLKPWFGLSVEPYRGFPKRDFLLLGSQQHFLNWILRDLVGAGSQLELKDLRQDVLLFEVRRRAS